MSTSENWNDAYERERLVEQFTWGNFMDGYEEALSGFIGPARSLEAFLEGRAADRPMLSRTESGHIAGCVAVHFGVDLSLKYR